MDKRARRHHYLPVFLLRCFRLRESDRIAKVRVIRKNAVFETAVHNVGVERDFHTSSAFFSDPEQILSEQEGEFATELNRWKIGRLDERGGAAADRLVFHLRFRSKVMRRIGSEVMDIAVATSGDAINQAVTASRPLQSMKEQLGCLIQGVAEKARCGTWDVADELQTDIRLKEIVSRHLSHWAVFESARFARFVVEGGLPAEMIANVHTTLILTTLLNHRKRAAYGDCHWAVVRTDKPLLLGDVGPLGRYPGARRLKPIVMSSLPLASIYLPIGPKRLLVGWYGPGLHVPSEHVLNAATVALSREFVVGNMPRNSMEQLRENLGCRSDEDSAQSVLGVEMPNGCPLVDEVTGHLVQWAHDRVWSLWNGTPVSPHQINQKKRVLPKSLARLPTSSEVVHAQTPPCAE